MLDFLEGCLYFFFQGFPCDLLGISKSIDDAITSGAHEAKHQIRALTSKLILSSVITWIRNLSLIFSAFIFGKVGDYLSNLSTFFASDDGPIWWLTIFDCLSGHTNTLVAIAVLFIDLCLIYRIVKYTYKYITLSIEYHSLNPFQIFRRYIEDEILNRVKERVSSSWIEWIALKWSGRSKKTIARETANKALSLIPSYIVIRVILFILGFILYLAIYESLFHFVTGIDFKSWWEPFIWPFKFLFF